jgi:hypothetical protein
VASNRKKAAAAAVVNCQPLLAEIQSARGNKVYPRLVERHSTPTQQHHCTSEISLHLPQTTPRLAAKRTPLRRLLLRPRGATLVLTARKLLFRRQHLIEQSVASRWPVRPLLVTNRLTIIARLLPACDITTTYYSPTLSHTILHHRRCHHANSITTSPRLMPARHHTRRFLGRA